MKGRIIEVEPGRFKVQVRRWYGWNDVFRGGVSALHLPVAYYATVGLAEASLRDVLKRASFRPRVVKEVHGSAHVEPVRPWPKAPARVEGGAK